MELPYSDDSERYSMLIFLPKNESINALDDFIRNEFTEDMILSAYNSGSYEGVKVEIPKMNFDRDYELSEVTIIF